MGGSGPKKRHRRSSLLTHPMNIQNYILPVSIAATLHVALLLYGVREPSRPKTIVVDISPTPPPKPEDPVLATPENPPDEEQSVRSLSDAPAPPTNDEPPVTPKTTDIVMPATEPITSVTRNLLVVPPVIGHGGPETGDPASRVPHGLFSPIQLDRIPRATVQQPPDYPAAMQQEGVTGSATVEFDVDREGRVVRAEAVRCTRHEFAGPAVRAVLQWHFEPGRRDGRPVPFRMTVPIEFSLPAN